MTDSGKNDPKRARRVSFARERSDPPTRTRPGPPSNSSTNASSPTLSHQSTSDIPNFINPDLSHSSSTNPPQKPPPSCPTKPAVDPDAGLYTHTVANTPQGLVIDGVLRPRGPATHSDTSDYHRPSVVNQPYKPGYPAAYYYPHLPNMSTVGAGFMPDPNAVHYQPPVPDTTNGAYRYTYVPRSDQPGPNFVAPGAPVAAVPLGGVPVAGVPFVGGPAFYTPGAFPQQPQSGMATAPIPIVPAGAQPAPMQAPIMAAPVMAAPGVNVQPGAVPPMAYPAPGIPVMAPGVGPTPPVASPGTYFVPGAHGGFEMGKTKAEVDADNRARAAGNQMYEPQNMKPADDDISRMYWCRELDGHWISRSRGSLDSMGNFRWYVTENGVFYAVMVPE